jgi:hypothetical protein
VGPRAGLDTEAAGKILSPLPGIEPRSPGRPATIPTELPSSPLHALLVVNLVKRCLIYKEMTETVFRRMIPLDVLICLKPT